MAHRQMARTKKSNFIRYEFLEWPIKPRHGGVFTSEEMGHIWEQVTSHLQPRHRQLVYRPRWAGSQAGGVDLSDEIWACDDGAPLNNEPK